MRELKIIEVTTIEENLGELIGPQIDLGRAGGFDLEEVEYSTSYDHVWRRVRSCALIIMSKDGE